MNLPPFPVDDATLDLLWSALGHEPDAQRTSVGEFLTLMSQLGGSDTTAVESVEDDIHLMRDPQYHINDVLAALVIEVRRLRNDKRDGCDCWKGWSEFHDHPTFQCRRAAVRTAVGGSTLTGFRDVPVCGECGKLIDHGQ